MAVQVTYYTGNKIAALKSSLTRCRLLNFNITVLIPRYMRGVAEEQEIDQLVIRANGTVEYTGKTTKEAEITFLINTEDELPPVIDEIEKLIDGGHKIILQLPTKLMHLRHTEMLRSEKLVKVQLQIVA